MSVEMRLLSRIVDTQDLVSALKQKITVECFMSTKARAVYKFILDHYSSPAHPREVPSLDMIHRQFSWFDYLPTTDSVSALAEEVRKNKLRHDLAVVLDDSAKLLAMQPEEALGVLGNKVSSLARNYIVAQDMDLSCSLDSIREYYKQAKNSNGIIGLPTPWASLNQETMGIHTGNLWVMHGPTGAMKTWLALAMCAHLYSLAPTGKRVLIITTEMTQEEIHLRLASILSRVDWGHFRHGTLQPAMERYVFDLLDHLAHTSNGTGRNIIVADSHSSASSNLTMIRAKIEEEQPDFVMIDGFYRLIETADKRKSQGWEAIGGLIRDIKEMAKQNQVPILALTQSNAEGYVAYSKDTEREADLIACIKKSKSGDGTYIDFNITKHRNDGGLQSFRILARPGGTFDEVQGSAYFGGDIGQDSDMNHKDRALGNTFRKFRSFIQ